MKLPPHEFKKLQDEWYAKLADSGFNDIEKFVGGEWVLDIKYSDAAICRNMPDPFIRELQEEYYRTLNHTLQNENVVFKKEIHRYILTRHSEGAKAKTISEELEEMGQYAHRHTIRFIVRRYESAWGIKNYRPTQLNKKKA